MDQPVSPKNSPTQLGDKIDALYELRERKRELQSELKALEEEYKLLEAAILDDMDAQRTTLSRTARASASITETEVPTVVDWEAVQDYIRNNDALYLYEQRLAARAWRELKDSGVLIPGTTPFTRRSLSLRKL